MPLGTSETSQSQVSRCALLVGAHGRLGEALLNGLASTSNYEMVHVATTGPIEMGVAKVKGVTPNQWPRVDDAYLVINDTGDLFSSSWYGRHEMFEHLESDRLADVIAQIALSGAQRICCIASLSAFQQMSGAAAAMHGPGELAMQSGPFETVLIMRPTPISEPQKKGSFFERFIDGYFSLNFFSIPRAFEPMRANQVAQVAVQTLLAAAPGISVLTADKMRARFEATQSNAPNKT